MVSALRGIYPAEMTEPLLVGLDEPDDAAVYRYGDTALIFTADYFPPVVDDAYTYGAAAASNALSDIFAMGGRPLLALNLAGFPEDMPLEVATAILRGGAEKAREAGCLVAGGHTTTSEEPTYGLAVVGTAAPDALIRKGGARPGDRLVLTKPLGVGVITTAAKRGTVQPAALEAAVASMVSLNAVAAEAARTAGVRGGTDVTGFGLIGHALEVAQASGVALRVRASAVPLLPGALHHAGEGAFPGGAVRNQEHFAPQVEVGAAVDPLVARLLFSPETAGGLLLAVPAHEAANLVARCRAAGVPATVIGDVQDGKGLLVE
jgi:selenide,water dikinase